MNLNVFTAACLSWAAIVSSTITAADIQFDLPPVVAAVTQPSTRDDIDLVTVELRLSSLITTPMPPSIDQWLVRCQPRDAEAVIADYAPRTETASDVASPIQIKKTDEKSSSFGTAINGVYGNVANGNLGADQGQKNIETIEYQRHASLQAVTASGTINRGQGVYFKLRWTRQQVLEGEKVFSITLAVPRRWRGSLIDVSVVAQGQRKTFAGFDHETQTVGAANFVVAAYRAGDSDAALHANTIAEAERHLRVLAAKMNEPASRSSLSSLPSLSSLSSLPSLPSMLRHVAIKLDLDTKPDDNAWLSKLIAGSADPYLDKRISQLPMPLRVAAIDYAASRKRFSALNYKETPETIESIGRIVAAKPAMP